MITDLAAMMEERLNAFKARSHVLPERILVYRDGVSEARHPRPPPYRAPHSHYMHTGPIRDRRGGRDA